MSEEIKEGYFPSRKEDLIEWSSLKMFEAHINKKIREVIEREFYDPRDDEMMNEIYPNG